MWSHCMKFTLKTEQVCTAQGLLHVTKHTQKYTTKLTMNL